MLVDNHCFLLIGGIILDLTDMNLSKTHTGVFMVSIVHLALELSLLLLKKKKIYR